MRQLPARARHASQHAFFPPTEWDLRQEAFVSCLIDLAIEFKADAVRAGRDGLETKPSEQEAYRAHQTPKFSEMVVSRGSVVCPHATWFKQPSTEGALPAQSSCWN